MEQSPNINTLSHHFKQLTLLEPKLVATTVPSNAAEQRAAFLAGEVASPDHAYDRLTSIDFNERYQMLHERGRAVLDAPDMSPKFLSAYQEFVQGYQKKTRMMELMALYKSTSEVGDKAALEQEFMTLNIELYGEPDEATFRSLLHEKLQPLYHADFTGEAAQIRDELFELVTYDDETECPKRYTPAQETVDWMHTVVETLYGDMLVHVPEQATFDTFEVKAVFDAIIETEFGEAAKNWRVDIEPAKSINVKSTEKRIIIPASRADVPREELGRLVVHELGVHMLRAIMGEATDLNPLANGLNDYYDSEEGLSKVNEQALNGEYTESGVEPYITAGLGYFNHLDFRDTYEVKWRISALTKAMSSGEVSDAMISKSKGVAYDSTMRSRRGTDSLPWFKDLAYYNGSKEMWQYLEGIRGDDIMLMFVLIGKLNPANRTHRRAVLETRSLDEAESAWEQQ